MNRAILAAACLALAGCAIGPTPRENLASMRATLASADAEAAAYAARPACAPAVAAPCSQPDTVASLDQVGRATRQTLDNVETLISRPNVPKETVSTIMMLASGAIGAYRTLLATQTSTAALPEKAR